MKARLRASQSAGSVPPGPGCQYYGALWTYSTRVFTYYRWWATILYKCFMKVQRFPIEYYLILNLAKMWRSIFKTAPKLQEMIFGLGDWNLAIVELLKIAKLANDYKVLAQAQYIYICIYIYMCVCVTVLQLGYYVKVIYDEILHNETMKSLFVSIKILITFVLSSSNRILLCLQVKAPVKAKTI